jgi:hypothetical protein
MQKALLITAVLGVWGCGGSDDPMGSDDPILQPETNPHGQSYDQWGTEWWQWVIATPASDGPIGSTSCTESVQPRDDVWFLAGTRGEGAVTRTCDVPADTCLFFPILNVVWWNWYEVADCMADSDEERLVAAINSNDGREVHLEVTLDGHSVPIDSVRHRASATGFEINGPMDDALLDWTGPVGPHMCPDGPAEGTIRHAAHDGWWLFFAPLEPGPHTLHIVGEARASDGTAFITDATYELNVLATPAP